MASVPLLFQFQRSSRQPIDANEVFADLTALQTYLATGPAYAGQLVTVTDTEPPEVYVVVREGASAPFTYSASPIGGGAGASMPEPPDDDQLYGRTRAPSDTAGTWEQIADDGVY